MLEVLVAAFLDAGALADGADEGAELGGLADALGGAPVAVGGV